MKKLIFIQMFFLTTVAIAAPQVQTTWDLINIQSQAAEKLSLVTTKKATAVIFLSSQCPCSKSHEELLKKMSAEYSDFQFVAIHANQDEDTEQVQRHFQTTKLPFSVLHDQNAKLADALKAFKTPHAFLISPKGEILYSGGITDSNAAAKAKENYLKSALDDIRSGNQIQKPSVRTLGCVISREGQEQKENVWKN